MPNNYAIILAGGSGTRFWPASRRLMPKQLLPIGPTNEPLIAATVRRLLPLCGPERILVATGRHLLDATRAALPELPDSAFLGEPVARNTAPCIAWATSVVAGRDPEARVMVVPSDQHIGDEAEFRRVLEKALDAAARGPITTVGIQPTRPETGYGYIEAAEELAPGILRVQRFVEKPDRERAEEYLKSGRYFWNSGMFFFQASTLLEAVATHLPELSQGLERIGAARGSSSEERIVAEVFNDLPSVSIDYGIMEKAKTLQVVPGSFDWSDLGDWHSAWELGEKDASGNVADPGTLLVAAGGNLVRNLQRAPGKKKVALLGVEDLCVIQTDDVLLVLPRAEAQRVREVVAAIQEQGLEELL